MNYRYLILLCSALISLYGNGQPKLANSAKPNVIIILADDLGYADLSMHGSLQIATPNIDKLASTGVTFSQAYVSSAVCSPSRAGLLTGINQVEFGYDNNLSHNTIGFDPELAGLPVDQKTLATLLKKEGYTTGIVGKWHLGSLPQFHPVNRGFDEFWGYLGGGHDYFEWKEGATGRRSPIESNFKKPQAISYITDDKGDECIEFIKRHKKKPFFLYASFNAPHAPMQATPEDLTLYEHIEDESRRTYAAMVHRLDINVGRILESLNDLDIRKNTMVIFLSDNGGPADQNFSNNAPYRGQKGILLEGGIRVPFIFSMPGSIPEGTTYGEMVSSLDIVPTILSKAGARYEPSTYTGVNLLPYLENEGDDVPHQTMMWKFTISTALRHGDWKLVSIPDRLPMLYHLPTDTTEERDLSLDNLERTRKMLLEIGEWEVSLPHPLFLEGSEWKKKQLLLYDKEYITTQPE